MGEKSRIEWTDATWNPWTGCHKVSPGCANCYAEGIAERFRGQKSFPHGFEPMVRNNRLTSFAPERGPRVRKDGTKGTPYSVMEWNRPRMIFVCSMSDFFLEDIPDIIRDQAWKFLTSYENRRHTFQILTKRPEEALRYLKDKTIPSNVWVGVTAENQAMLEKRLPLLLQIPAKTRFLSCEPLLSALDFSLLDAIPKRVVKPMSNPIEYVDVETIHWVISGGESGHPDKVRNHPDLIDWFRSIRDQCEKLGINYFHKQHGGSEKCSCHGTWGCRILDGKVHDAMPHEKAKTMGFY